MSSAPSLSVLVLLALGCSSAYENPGRDAAPEPDLPESSSPCPPGWVPEPGACARWARAAAYPIERCEPGSVTGPAVSAYGSPLVRCGDLGFTYQEGTDEWIEELGQSFDADDWTETLPAPEPGERRLVAPLWGDRLLLLRRDDDSDWEAARVSFSGDDSRPTASPPNAPVALLPLSEGRAIAAASEQSAIYQRRLR